MSQNPPTTVVCEISSLEPISGRLRGESGRSQEFHGWMDFATALLAVAGADQQPRNPESLPAQKEM